MRNSWLISRRAVLKGAGACLPLPALECMIPGGRKARAAAKPPRLMWFVIPHGIPERARSGVFFPRTTGSGYAVPKLLKPLENAGLIEDCLVVSGLVSEKGRGGTPGRLGSDHGYAPQALLTCVEILHCEVIEKVTANISVDQVAANALKPLTPNLPSLFLGTGGDGGADGTRMVWTSPTQSIPMTTDPGRAFDRAFGTKTGAQSAQQVLALNTSV